MKDAPSSAFISHSALDKAFVRRLARDLEAQTIKCWVDEAEIRPGDDFVSKIENGLNTATHVLIILSEHSIISSWVREETHAAQIRAIQGQTRLVPVLLGSIKPEDMPLLLQSKLYVDFRDPTGYQKELSKLLSAFQVDVDPSKIEFAEILLPRVENAVILRGDIGSGCGIELLVTNPSATKYFIQEVSIGAFQPSHILYAESPPVFTYQLDLQLGTSLNGTAPVIGTAKEPNDQWGRPATGYFRKSGGSQEFEISCPFYLELEPKDRALLRFLFAQPKELKEVGRNTFPRRMWLDEESKEVPTFSERSDGWGGYTRITLSGAETNFGAHINDISLLGMFRSLRQPTNIGRKPLLPPEFLDDIFTDKPANDPLK